MATPVLQATAIFDPEFVRLPQAASAFGAGNYARALGAVLPASAHDYTHFEHPEAGRVQVKNAAFPHGHVMHMRWQTARDFELYDPTAATSVNINFMLEGSLDSQFRGIRHDVTLRTRTHNLLSTPEAGHRNQIPGGQSLSMLLLSLDSNFFTSSLGQDAWSERVRTDLHHQRPFSAANGAQILTPRMRSLLDAICHGTSTGPMRNLLLQSRVLELVALQLEQFSTPAPATETVPAHEAEKLHRLKDYLDAHFLADHSLAQLSRYCLLNEFKVKKGFKLLFNTTVFNYLRQLRMEYAGRLLRDSTTTVDEVADALGYEHSQHFSIAFKKYTGLTPSQYQLGKQRAGA